MNHLVYIDDRGSYNELHLTLECRRAGHVTGHDVDPDACASELDNWLRANPGRELTELAITTSRVHHGDFAPVIDVLAARRPRVSSLMLGALTFPDFDRGSYIPDDLSRDGSSWQLAVPLDQVLKALPTLEELVVQANSISTWGARTFTAPRLRHLVIRDDSLDPDVVAALGQSSLRSLEILEIWLAIPLEEVAALRDMTRGALVATWQRTWLDGQARFEPPLVSLFDARPRE